MSFIVSYYNNSGDENILKVVYDYFTLRETELSSGGVCCGPKEAELSSGALQPNLTSEYDPFAPGLPVGSVILS